MWNLFFRNRRLLVLSVALIAVAGFSSLQVLPRMEDPLLTPRFGIINTRFPGADAERVEALVTNSLEDALRQIEEIKELRSTSRAGISTISVELRDDIDATQAIWSRVRDKLSDVESGLPEGAFRPEFDEQDVKAYAAIVALKWRHDETPNWAILRRLAERLKDQLKAVAGTDEVDVFGDPQEEFLVTVHPAELVHQGLTFAEVSRQLAASDAKVSSGQLRSQQNDLILKLDTELDSLRRIADTPIRTGPKGQVTRLGDIATIRKAIEEPPAGRALVSGRPAIVLGVLVRDDLRIDQWMDKVHAELNRYRQTVSSGVELSLVFDQSQYVAVRLSGLVFNLVAGGLGIVLVIGLLMGWRNALVVGSALPLSARWF